MRIQKTSRQPASSGLLPGPSGGHQPAEPGLAVCGGGICLLPVSVRQRGGQGPGAVPGENAGAAGPPVCGQERAVRPQLSARGQAARLYRTEVVREPERLTQAGDGYCWLKGWAYMVRTPDNQGLIAEIEGGIKKEVSVGCAVKRAVCSICGTERGQDCGHKPGEVYDGARCFFQLEEAVDAYEFSFVAVPAQPRAGVVKGLCPAGEPAQTLRELAAGRDLCIRELDGLEREAALGRKWLSTLREEVVRMGALADSGLDRTVLKQITDKLDAEELQALKRAYQARARERYPLPVQLEYAQKPGEEPREDGAFLI